MLREIPRDDWEDFLAQFSDLHRRWFVCVDTQQPGDSATHEDYVEVQLQSVDLVSIPEGGRGVSILLGDAETPMGFCLLTEPAFVRVREDYRGAHEALEIETATGERAIIRFRSAVLPEMMNGIVDRAQP